MNELSGKELEQVTGGSSTAVKRAVIQRDRCLYCGTCVETCDPGAIKLHGNDYFFVDRTLCTGCGVCLNACPMCAIVLE